MITARSAGEPVTASVTLSMIGCVKLKNPPGICRLQALRQLLDEVGLDLAVTARCRTASARRTARCDSVRTGSVPSSLRPVCEADLAHFRRLLDEPADLARPARPTSSARCRPGSSRESRSRLRPAAAGTPSRAACRRRTRRATTSAGAGEHAAGMGDRRRAAPARSGRAARCSTGFSQALGALRNR